MLKNGRNSGKLHTRLIYKLSVQMASEGTVIEKTLKNANKFIETEGRLLKLQMVGSPIKRGYIFAFQCLMLIT